MFVKCSIGGPSRGKPLPARVVFVLPQLLSLRMLSSIVPEMLAQMDISAARLSSLSMPHRKHGLKTRVAFVPAADFVVGFPS